MLIPSRVDLLALFDNVRNSCLILALGWIAITCGCSSASSAQSIELQEVLSIGGFFDIMDITVGQDGSIYVADRRDFSISKYDSQGQLVSQIGSLGVALGKFVGSPQTYIIGVGLAWVDPGEFFDGPYSIALLDSILIATDEKGMGTMHFFDLDLNYTGSDQIIMTDDMDSAPNGLLYYGSIDLIDITAFRSYIRTYVPNGEMSRIFELRDMHKYRMENSYFLLAGYPGKIVIVFETVNRIDVYDLSGNILNRLSVADLPLRYEGSFMDLKVSTLLPDHVVESMSYVYGGIMFTGAVLDREGNLFLEHGGKNGEMPVRRSVYVMTLAGEEKGVFKMPPHTHLFYMDKKGYAYAVTRTRSTDLLKKYKLEYLE